MWNILQGDLDAFNRTLCALITFLFLCCVYWRPLSVAPCPFDSPGLFNIRTLFTQWLFIWKHKQNHGRTHTVYVDMLSLQDIRGSSLIRISCSFSSQCQPVCYFLLKVCFHASWDLSMWGKGTRRWDSCLESFLVLMCLSTLLLLLWNAGLKSKGATMTN